MNTVLFFIFGLIAIVAAVGVIASRNAIHSVLFLLVNFGTLAFLFMFLNAVFLAAAQVSVYAGAIVVLFLFVVMLLGNPTLPADLTPRLPLSRYLAIILGVLLLAALIYGSVFGGLTPNPASAAQSGGSTSNVQDLGRALYTDFLLPFELASVLLLVGVVGAIALARRKTQAEIRNL